MNKLLITGIALMSAGTVGILFAVVMEMATGESIYWLVMKITAGLFGVGGPLFGLALARRKRS
ncbi:hypothetical protein ES703_81795 [subsurface metagenome]|uniref:Uncharacterized protein n=1 Tax=marine sediment metagenome TaxID=412755 RepID=X1UNH0_9ZZZZ